MRTAFSPGSGEVELSGPPGHSSSRYGYRHAAWRVLGLQWADFADDFSKVTINRVLVRPNKVRDDELKWRLEAPKTNKSRRTLALDKTLVKQLKHDRAQQNAERQSTTITILSLRTSLVGRSCFAT